MTYFEKLHPWCIISPLPNLQRRIVARFRRRSDAEAHMQLIRRLIPSVTHELIFDVTSEDAGQDLLPNSKASDHPESTLRQRDTVASKELGVVAGSPADLRRQWRGDRSVPDES